MKAVVKDGFGDRAEVEANASVWPGRVWLNVHPRNHPEDNVLLDLTPKKARRLAKALRDAAKEIDRA